MTEPLRFAGKILGATIRYQAGWWWISIQVDSVTVVTLADQQMPDLKDFVSGVAAAFLAEHLGAEVDHILAPERPARPDDQLRLPIPG